MLDRECRQLEASFFQSETDVLTPYYYINSRIGTAAALAAIGDLYPDLAEETQALRDAGGLWSMPRTPRTCPPCMTPTAI